MPSAMRNRVAEIVLESGKGYGDPFNEVEVSARLFWLGRSRVGLGDARIRDQREPREWREPTGADAP